MMIQARVKYYNDYCVAYLPKDFCEYYISISPRYLCIRPQGYKPHITICRKSLEFPDYTDWLYRDKDVITVYYDVQPIYDGNFWFFNCYSSDIIGIRKSLNLPIYRDGFLSYHITIGNSKNS